MSFSSEGPGKRSTVESLGPTGQNAATPPVGPGKRTLTEGLPMSMPVAIAAAATGSEPGLTTEADMIRDDGDPAGGKSSSPKATGVASHGPATATPSAAPMPAAQPQAGHAELAATGAATTGAATAGAATAGAATTGAATADAPPAGPTPAPTPAPTLVITGPREMWYFDGETPAGYDISKALGANRTGGTFAWTCSANLRLSAASGATPTVTSTAASGTVHDAWIRVSHTDASGTATAARYQLTIKAPSSLGFLRNNDNPDPTFAYMTYIHYSIKDQFGAILPRNVPVNEQFTAAPTADSAGMDWRRGPAGAALVSPTDWADQVGGETAGHTPAPVAPGAAGAATAVCHWPGDWRVGSMTVGSGRAVKSVTWSKSRGFARHT